MRRGRPGLIGTVARTAVIAGTANATSNAMNNRRASKAQAAQGGQPVYEEAPAPAPVAAPVAAPAVTSDVTAELMKLAEMKGAGLLTDEEFSAAKMKLLMG